MVSGSRACLTFILSDHPHRPSRHFDGALHQKVGLLLAIPAVLRCEDLAAWSPVPLPSGQPWVI
jgi:hypothetical protein